MIERYTLPEMGRIWSEENKFRKWLEIELLACECLSRLGEVPGEALREIKERASFDLERIKELEEKMQHEVIAFLANVAENVGSEARFIHMGLTSSDLIDTALSCFLKEAGEHLLKRLEWLREAVKEKALAHKHTVMAGRTHGVHAEPITFGLKLLVWYDELRRRGETLRSAVSCVSVGKISGAVGTYAHLDKRVEAYVLGKLGLAVAPASTQILQRDRHAEFAASLSLLASSLEKMATEVRNLQRTEILEVEEYFREGQKGSSAMPHKRNPITCERICGLSRLVRANAAAAMDNVALWHERDISHSSLERIILPDSTIALDYMLDRFTWVVENLIVYPENMKKNLEKTGGLIYSQRLLLELTKTGLPREDAYRLVQEAAMETWKTGKPFAKSVREREAITSHLDRAKLDEVFSPEAFLREVDAIFDRVLQ